MDREAKRLREKDEKKEDADFRKYLYFLIYFFFNYLEMMRWVDPSYQLIAT